MAEERKEQPRDRQIVRASLVGVGANVLLAAFKAFAGLLAHSIAIVLDALNNLSDALSSVITIVGMKLAALPADKKHPFGHGRAEYLSAILIAGLVLAAGVSALVESVKKIFHPEPADYSVLTLVIVAAAIVVKLLLGRYTQRVGRATKSDSLIASGADATFDAVISASTLVAAVVTMIWKVSVDGYLGAVIAIVIVRAGVEMLRDTLSEILGQRADVALSRAIKEAVAAHPGALGAYDLILHNYGPEKMIGSVHVGVYDTMTARELHKLTRDIQLDIAEQFNIFLTVGFYAVNTANDNAAAVQKASYEYALAQPYVLKVHGFYMDPARQLISFDVVIDFQAKDSVAIRDHIAGHLQRRYPPYTFSINIDRDFSD